MKKTIAIIMSLVLISSLFCSFLAFSANADTYLYCSQCGKSIPAESKYCMYCGSAVVRLETKTNPEWGSWSSWSTTRVYASDTRQVQRRTVEEGYNMVHYGTQVADPPYSRMFRNYSIKANLGDYNARASYGEKYFTRYVTPGMLKYAVKYEPGEHIEGEYAGYQCGNTTAYSFGDDKYVWFIESTVTRTEYRYRDLMG